MNVMNQKRLELLKTIRKENPELCGYMNDIITEMENPRSAFNTGRVTNLSELDKLTIVRLCDAFDIAKNYSEKYHLNLTELIELVSEETILLIKENKVAMSGQFKKYIEYSIRKHHPFRNPLVARDEWRNCNNYNRYDDTNNSKRIGSIDTSNVSFFDSILLEPIQKLTDSEYSRDTVESITDYRLCIESIEKALKELDSAEESVLRTRYGFETGHPCTLAEVGEILGLSRSRIGQIEVNAIRKLHSRRYFPRLRELSNIHEICCTPVGRGELIEISNSKERDTFHTFVCWKLFCYCGKRVECAENINIGNTTRKIFYCKSCGRIYEIKNEKLKQIPWYCLKRHSSENSLDRE